MNLLELASKVDTSANTPSVPEWMIGAFRRRSISFADGTSDVDTRVFWLQSRQLTVDLRLPASLQEQATGDLKADRLAVEGWYAYAQWRNELSWSGGASLHQHNRWPEPAQLRRVGNCMVEFAPSGAYVEDWRLLNDDGESYLVGLELVSETDLSSGRCVNRSGALVINGDVAGLVLAASGDQRFTALVCERTESGVFVAQHSMYPEESGTLQLCLDGFETASQPGHVLQRVKRDDTSIARLWKIDCLEASFGYRSSTLVQCSEAQAWRRRESATLDRYTQRLI